MISDFKLLEAALIFVCVCLYSIEHPGEDPALWFGALHPGVAQKVNYGFALHCLFHSVHPKNSIAEQLVWFLSFLSVASSETCFCLLVWSQPTGEGAFIPNMLLYHLGFLSFSPSSLSCCPWVDYSKHGTFMSCRIPLTQQWMVEKLFKTLQPLSRADSLLLMG